MLYLDLSNERPEVEGNFQDGYIGFKRSVFPAGEVFFKITPFSILLKTKKVTTQHLIV